MMRAIVVGLLALAATLPLCAAPLPASCGEPVARDVCKPGAACESGLVLDVPDAWHGLAQCFRRLRDLWARHGGSEPVRAGRRDVGHVSVLVARQVAWEMSRPRTRTVEGRNGRPSMALLLNDRGQPYNAMGQTGVAYFLYQFAALSEGMGQGARQAAEMYRHFAWASVTAVLTDVSDGGLASWRDCAVASQRRCVWFHSVTRRDLPTRAGATLNQHLHAVRDLGLIADLLAARGDKQQAHSLDEAVKAGIAQLIAARKHGDGSPNLASFLFTPMGKAEVRWSYYGWNREANVDGDGYLLKEKGRNCAYHFHVVELLAQIFARARKQSDAAGLVSEALACGGPLDQLVRTARIRLTDEDSKNWGSSKGGEAFSCPREVITPSGRYDAPIRELSCRG